jgi:hypothetical protein
MGNICTDDADNAFNRDQKGLEFKADVNAETENLPSKKKFKEDLKPIILNKKNDDGSVGKRGKVKG